MVKPISTCGFALPTAFTLSRTEPPGRDVSLQSAAAAKSGMRRCAEAHQHMQLCSTAFTLSRTEPLGRQASLLSAAAARSGMRQRAEAHQHMQLCSTAFTLSRTEPPGRDASLPSAAGLWQHASSTCTPANTPVNLRHLREMQCLHHMRVCVFSFAALLLIYQRLYQVADRVCIP